MYTICFTEGTLTDAANVVSVNSVTEHNREFEREQNAISLYATPLLALFAPNVTLVKEGSLCADTVASHGKAYSLFSAPDSTFTTAQIVEDARPHVQILEPTTAITSVAVKLDPKASTHSPVAMFKVSDGVLVGCDDGRDDG